MASTFSGHLVHLEPVHSRSTAWPLEAFRGISEKVWSRACRWLPTETSKSRRHRTTTSSTTPISTTSSTTTETSTDATRRSAGDRSLRSPTFTSSTTARGRTRFRTPTPTMSVHRARNMSAFRPARYGFRSGRNSPARRTTRQTRATKVEAGQGFDTRLKIGGKNPFSKFDFFQKMTKLFYLFLSQTNFCKKDFFSMKKDWIKKY